MYYEFESGFDKYFKGTKLSSTEGILSELKSTKAKLSIYRFLYFATVTLFFISIVSALLITIFNSKSSERIYFYDLPRSQLFGAAGFLGVFIDENNCYQDCIYRKKQGE